MTVDFDPSTVPVGTKGVYRLSIPAKSDVNALVGQVSLASSDTTSEEQIRDALVTHWHDEVLSVPVLAARGRDSGETLVVTAGVHGDEYEGILALYRIFEELDPARMRGLFVAVPVVTLPAFWLGTRTNPVDGRNMARVFPGSPTGTLTERLASKLLDRVLSHASLYLDLHSAGSNYHMLTSCGYVASGAQRERAREAAERFDAPFTWEHPSVSPGRTLSATLELGIPSLYAETYGGGARAVDVDGYVRGVANLLKFLEIVELASTGRRGEPTRRLYGSGDLDVAVTCSASGLYVPATELGRTVGPGHLLGVVRDFDGEIVDHVRASENGIVILTRATPRVFAGELVAALAAESRRSP